MWVNDVNGSAVTKTSNIHENCFKKNTQMVIKLMWVLYISKLPWTSSDNVALCTFWGSCLAYETEYYGT